MILVKIARLYENLFASAFTYNRISSFVHPVLYFGIVSYTHSLDSLHNLLSHLHSHAHLLLLHSILMTINFLQTDFDLVDAVSLDLLHSELQAIWKNG